jgi:hypothetical protein
MVLHETGGLYRMMVCAVWIVETHGRASQRANQPNGYYITNNQKNWADNKF